MFKTCEAPSGKTGMVNSIMSFVDTINVKNNCIVIATVINGGGTLFRKTELLKMWHFSPVQLAIPKLA